MKALTLAATLACLTAPAWAQPPACTGRQTVSREFVESFNAANGALARKDYASALSLTALARPHATSVMLQSAVAQIETAAYVGLDDRPAASARMKSALSDPCLPPNVHTNYIEKLAEWGMSAN